MGKIIISLGALFLIFIIGCSTTQTEKSEVVEEEKVSETIESTSDDNQIADTKSYPKWMDVTLKDIRTGETFKISDFRGKKVLLESFAVWCPTCTKQQKNVKALHEELGDSFVSISLDTDPNEEETQILEHINRNGFTWYYVISPVELTKSLIDEFGIGFVNAPAAPVVLINEDSSTRFLGRGLKSVRELKEALGGS